MDDTEPDSRTVVIDTRRERLDVEVVHGFLTTSYWAKGIPLDVVERSIASSLCFGAYLDGVQVGFARIISDYATFAFLCDVFVVDAYRGRGISKRLMDAVIAHPSLQGLRRWSLATRDAHGLYERYGFTALAAPDRWMERHDPGVYAR